MWVQYLSLGIVDLLGLILQLHPAEIVHSDIEWLQDLL